VLSLQGDLIDCSRLELEQSTSASALLLSSIDGARRQFQRDGQHLLGRAIDHAERLREAISEMPGLDLMGTDVTGGPGALTISPPFAPCVCSCQRPRVERGDATSIFLL